MEQIIFSNNINGDNVKFYDYFLSVSRVDKTPIHHVTNQRINLASALQSIRPVNINFDKKKLKSILFYDKNGFTRYIKYLYAKLKN